MEKSVQAANSSALIISPTAKIGADRIRNDSIQVWAFLNQYSYSKNTKEAYERIIRKFFQFHPQAGILEITTPHVSLFLKTIEDQKPTTKNLYRAALSSFFRFLEVSGYITRNPVAAIKSAKVPKFKRVVDPGPEAIIRMVELEPGFRNRLIIKTLYILAPRVSELIELSQKSFTKDPNGRMQVMINGKGNKVRFVFVPEVLFEEIMSYVEENEIGPTEPIFFNPRDRKNHLTRNAINDIVRAAAKRAKVFPIPSPHRFRNISSQHARKNGATLEQIRDNLGHESLEITQIYLAQSEELGAADFLDLGPLFLGSNKKS